MNMIWISYLSNTHSHESQTKPNSYLQKKKKKKKKKKKNSVFLLFAPLLLHSSPKQSFVELNMETARSAFPVMRSSPCDRLTVHAGRYEGPLPVEAACGGKDHISNLKISKDSTAIRSITPIPSSSSSINAYPTRNKGLLLSSSGTKDSFAVKPIRPPLVNNQTQNSDLQFDEIQPSHQDLSPALRRDFDHFTARVALIDVELWAASWLRAETNYENKIDLRYVERFKLQYAQQQFKAMKKWFGMKHYAQKRFCLVTVRNDEKNCKRTAIQSVVGTLDVHVRHPLHGELYPGEGVNKPGIFDIYRTDQPQFGYISDVCVSKHARRQGIGRNMIYLAINISFSHGVENVFIHVDRENIAAQNLYQQMGFKIVERDFSPKPSDNILLAL